MKRWAIQSVLVSIVLVASWSMQPTDPINAANFAHIETGMTELQVEQILGGPETGEIQIEIQGQWEDIIWPKTWHGRKDRVITVYFRIRDGGYVVHRKELFDPRLWDRVKAWWGDYELDLHPIGGRTKRLEAAA